MCCVVLPERFLVHFLLGIRILNPISKCIEVDMNMLPRIEFVLIRHYALLPNVIGSLLTLSVQGYLSKRLRNLPLNA